MKKEAPTTTGKSLKDTAHEALRHISAQIAVMESELDTAHKIHTSIADLCDTLDCADNTPAFTKVEHRRPVSQPKGTRAAEMPPWKLPGKTLAEMPMRSKKKRSAIKKSASKRPYTKRSSWWKRKSK